MGQMWVIWATAIEMNDTFFFLLSVCASVILVFFYSYFEELDLNNKNSVFLLILVCFSYLCDFINTHYFGYFPS